MLPYVVLPPKTFHRGVKLPITMTIFTTVFRLLTVNYEGGLMCLKYKSYLPCKLHPNNNNNNLT